MNRASAQHGGDQSAKEGIIAFSDFFKSSMNRVVHNTFGWEDVEFTWADEENMFTPDKAKSYEIYCNIGAITINEIRDDLGLESIPGGDQSVLGANMQPMQFDTVNKLSDLNAQAQQQADQQHQVAMATAQNPATHVHVGDGAGGAGGSKTSVGKSPNGGSAGGGAGKKGGTPKGKGSPGGGNAARKVSYCLDYGEEPEPGEMLRFVEKGFDVTPSPIAGPQPYGADKRSRTMMHARGSKAFKKSEKKKITRTATAGARIADEERIGKLKATIHKFLVGRGAAVADGVVSARHRLSTSSRQDLSKATASPFHEGGWGDPSLPTPTIQQQSLIASLLKTGWEVLPSQIAPILNAEGQDAGVEVIASAGLIIDQDQWNAVEDEVAELALDRAGELVGMKWDKDDEKWIENPNAEWRIDEDVRDELAKLVSYAEEEGWSNADLRGAIVESNLFSEDRADLIARTELKYIDGMGAAAIAERTGATQKKWMLSSMHDDEDECDANAEADWISIDNDFPNGEDTVPAHPRCRCVVTYGWEQQTDEEQE